MNKNHIKNISISIGICIICIVIIPILINVLILKPRLFDIVGTSTDWLSFWGGYLGAVISAGVAFIILHIQRKDNERQVEYTMNENDLQNKHNRQLQINALKYQQKTQWLNELKSKCIEYYLGFDTNTLIAFKNSINIFATSQKDSIDILKELCEKKNSSEFAFGLMFPPQEFLSEKECQILSILRGYSNSYKVAISDIIWLCQLIDENIDFYSCNNKIALHENECKVKWGKQSKAIEYFETRRKNLIESADSKIFYKNAINYCVDTNVDIEYVQNALIALVDYEQEAINKILLNE